MNFPFSILHLLFSCPAVGADLIPVQADGFQQTVQSLIPQGVEAHLIADGFDLAKCPQSVHIVKVIKALGGDKK